MAKELLHKTKTSPSTTNMLHNISTRVYARASTVFRFLPSPLHHVRIKNWWTTT